MRLLFTVLVLAIAAVTQTPPEQLPIEDAVRIHEFYRLASQIQDQIWPDWSHTPLPLLLVTPETEFLTHWAEPPQDFKKVGDGFYTRPRKFPTNFLATFPAFGPPSVIVIGEPENTESKTSTPWLITVMHEHFHQLQNFQPGQEGIARYTQIKAAEAAAKYQPAPEYAALKDYEPFDSYAARARAETLSELRRIDLARSKRVVVYSFGAAEGLLLDKLNPGWKDEYF